VVTSDANGNLATDGGQIFERLNTAFKLTDENRSGVASALAAVNPDLTGDERFGITANWGNFAGANAFGMGLEGVLGHNWLTQGDRVAITGGWGVGFAEGAGDNVFGGRVGRTVDLGRERRTYCVCSSPDKVM
jgi:trimeric autotransporter adhesin